MIEPVHHVSRMAPYTLADVPSDPRVEVTSLAQNESLRGPSPAVAAAVQKSLKTGADYPDPDWTDLRTALAELHQINAAQVLCGAGSMELIAALAQTYLDQTRYAVAPEFSYAFFQTAAERVGSRLIHAPERDYTVDVQALLSQVTPETRIVFVANPGNPTGTCIPTRDLVTLRKALPQSVLLVIDEAYGEFVDDTGTGAFDLVRTGRTVVLRTFSKAYGLAAARVGWGLFPNEVAQQVRKVLNPNNISTLSQRAAEAAVRDQSYMRETCLMTSTIRNRFSDALRELGFPVPKSTTNFVLIPFETPDEAASADRLLRSKGILMRNMRGYGLPQCLRATIASQQTMDTVIDALSTSEFREQKHG